MAATSEAVKMCSRCGKNPRADADSTNPWCTKCKAEKQKEFVEQKAAQDAAHNYALGVNAMREKIAAIFDRCGSAVFMAHEVAALIRREPAPRPDQTA